MSDQRDSNLYDVLNAEEARSEEESVMGSDTADFYVADSLDEVPLSILACLPTRAKTVFSFPRTLVFQDRVESEERKEASSLWTLSGMTSQTYLMNPRRSVKIRPSLRTQMFSRPTLLVVFQKSVGIWPSYAVFKKRYSVLCHFIPPLSLVIRNIK